MKKLNYRRSKFPSKKFCKKSGKIMKLLFVRKWFSTKKILASVNFESYIQHFRWCYAIVKPISYRLVVVLLLWFQVRPEKKFSYWEKVSSSMIHDKERVWPKSFTRNWWKKVTHVPKKGVKKLHKYDTTLKRLLQTRSEAIFSCA